MGPIKALKIAMTYPALFIMPIFTIWTFGPASIKKFCTTCCEKQVLKLSYPLTWLNLIISSTSPILIGVVFINVCYPQCSHFL